MATDIFGSLLEEFSTQLDIKLTPSDHNTCAIKTISGVVIQLEIDKSNLYMNMVCRLPDVPPSSGYRQNLFYEALKYNGLPPPHHAILAYSTPAGKMIIFVQLKLDNLNGEKMVTAFNRLLDKAQIWYDAITKGEVPSADGVSAGQPAANPFGLRP